MASARTLPESICGLAVSALAKVAAICPLITSVTAGAVPRYGTCWRSIPAMLFSSSMHRCGEGLRRQRRIDDQHVRRGGGERDRREVPDRVVRNFLVKHGIEREGARHHEQRVAVRRRAGDGFDADHVACPGLVLDEERLP